MTYIVQCLYILLRRHRQVVTRSVCEMGTAMIEDKTRVPVKAAVKTSKLHKIQMDNRRRAEITGVNDVISFDLESILLETDYGMLTICGKNLHVSRLSVEKGEVDIDGEIDGVEYAEVSSYAKKGESLLARLFK